MKVLKRDGSTEEFDIEKIKRVVMAAGLDEEQTQKLSDNLERWAKDQKKNPLPTSDIRKEVYEELEKLDEYAAGLYRWYKKTHQKEVSE